MAASQGLFVRRVFIFLLGVVFGTVAFLLMASSTSGIQSNLNPSSTGLSECLKASTKSNTIKLRSKGIAVAALLSSSSSSSSLLTSAAAAAASSSSSSEKPPDMRARFKKRRLLLETGCREYLRHKRPPKSSWSGYYFAIEVDTMYCPIEKTASTEWTTLMHRMQRRKVKVEQVRGDAGKLPTLDRFNVHRNASMRFLFVREPYLRLLSGYVDKLFSPNVVYWSSVGKHIVRNFRPRPSQLSLKCGHDVTFAEFIDYVIDAETTGTFADGHFAPIHQHCYVCDFPYSHVGHLETMSEDRQFILEVMKSPVAYTKDYALDDVHDQAKWYISDAAGGKFGDCLDQDEALRRLWQKLKLRGHLGVGQDFPFSALRANSVSAAEFVGVARRAIQRSRLREGGLDPARNKHLALLEAFRSVSQEKKEQLARLYRWDFSLFGYDPHPPQVFGPSPPLPKQTAVVFASIKFQQKHRDVSFGDFRS